MVRPKTTAECNPTSKLDVYTVVFENIDMLGMYIHGGILTLIPTQVEAKLGQIGGEAEQK